MAKKRGGGQNWRIRKTRFGASGQNRGVCFFFVRSFFSVPAGADVDSGTRRPNFSHHRSMLWWTTGNNSTAWNTCRHTCPGLISDRHAWERLSLCSRTFPAPLPAFPPRVRFCPVFVFLRSGGVFVFMCFSLVWLIFLAVPVGFSFRLQA